LAGRRIGIGEALRFVPQIFVEGGGQAGFFEEKTVAGRFDKAPEYFLGKDRAQLLADVGPHRYVRLVMFAGCPYRGRRNRVNYGTERALKHGSAIEQWKPERPRDWPGGGIELAGLAESSTQANRN